MSIDLGALFAVAAPLVASAIQTGGTTVTLTLEAAPGPPDPATAVAARGAEYVIAASVPALVIAETGGGQVEATPRAPRVEGRWRVLLLPDVELVDADGRPVGDGIIATVNTSLDMRLPGRRFRTIGLPDGSAGVVRTLVAVADSPDGRI